jgi:deoxyribose-phosphate aldolase
MDRKAKMPSHVICMGEVLIDFVAIEKNTQLPQVSNFSAAAGGAPANVAVGLQRLGIRSSFVGCVGKDPFGIKLRGELEAEGVDTCFLFTHGDFKENETDAVHTTINFVSVWDDGHKDLVFYRGADRCMLPQEITPAIFENAKCFHYGSISLIHEPGSSAQRKAIQVAREQKLLVTYDPNYRATLWQNETTAHRVIFDAFKYAHMAKVSEEEFSIVTGHNNLEHGIRALLDQGVELVVVTRGERGALAATEHFVVESPGLRDVNIVETTGAGDAFMATLISRMLPEFEKRGGSLKTAGKETVQAALDYANVVAGLACTKAGAIPALPTAQEVERFLDMSTCAPFTVVSDTLARMIDHTFLKPNCAEPDDIERLCQEARRYGFAVVCVNPSQVEQCCQLLQGSNVGVGAAIGFPLGQTTLEVKAFEIRDAIQRGATEIDMVLNIREMQSGNYDFVQSEIEMLVETCRELGTSSKVICKVILETCYLTTEEKIKACEFCRDAGVDFVKTSTGFGPAGATVEDVQLMRKTVGDAVGVKASGSIRDLAKARAMVDAGANRIGTSNGVAIMQELLKEEEGAL